MLSTLDISKKTIKKTLVTYIFLTILLYIASVIYLKLSYGVVSKYMKYLALIPLVLGVFLYFILSLFKNLKHNRISFNLYNSGVFTLTIGSLLQGILEICGAHSFYTIWYLRIGITLILISIILFIIKNKIAH